MTKATRQIRIHETVKYEDNKHFLVAVLSKPRFLLSLTTVVYESVYLEQIFLMSFFFFTIYKNRDLFRMVPQPYSTTRFIARKATKMASI